MASWPTPDVPNGGRSTTGDPNNPSKKQIKLHHAVKHGPPAPASSSTDGSRRELWPTITAHTPDMESSGPNGNQGVYLAGAVKAWATPRSAMASMHPEYGEHWNDNRGGESIATQVWREEQWGAPTARDHKSGRGNQDREYKELTPMVERQQAGKLNPRWVETLMGLPVGWTMPSCASPVTIAPMSCDCSETESSPQPQSELFACS
jgi:hypothetical protein